MAKVKRSVLKEIVKECLLEILFEGIDSEPGYDEEPIREARRPKRRASRPSPNNDLAAAVKRSTNNKKPPRDQGLSEQFVDNAVSELTTDPTMASIFADTAQTTLQEQRENRRLTADNAAAAVDNAEDMSDIFEGAGNWATIAFGETES